MHNKGKNNWIKHADFIIIDLLSMSIAFLISFVIKFRNLQLNMQWRSISLIIILLQFALNIMMHPYSGLFRRRFYEEITRTLRIVFISLFFVAVFLFATKEGWTFSRGVIFMTYGIYFFLSLLLKYIWKKLIVKGKIRLGGNKLKTLVIAGNTESVLQSLVDTKASDFPEYDIKAVFLTDENNDNEISIHDCEVKTLDELEHYVISEKIENVLISSDISLIDKDLVSSFIDKDISIHVNVESLFSFKPEDQFISRIGIMKTLSMTQYAFTPSQLIYFFFKRIIDILAGVFGCIVLLPLMGIVKVMNLLNKDTAPLFYRQKRVGRDGREIKIFKFRSMVPNADEVLKELLKNPTYASEWKKTQKIENDPRITKVGNILRKTSLDEWPQFINVLFGDMSLIGPRPLIFGELEEHNGLPLYNKVRPGITGWWGCNGRSNINYDERLDLEYYYVKHVSFHLDAICVLRTIFAVLKKSGAK